MLAAYGLLPKDVFLSVEQRTPGNLDQRRGLHCVACWTSSRRSATGDPAEVFAAIG